MLLVAFIGEVDIDTFSKRILFIACVIVTGIYIYNCLRYYGWVRLYRIRMFYNTCMWSVTGIGLVVALAVLGVKEGKAMMQSEPDYFEVTMTGCEHYTSAAYTYIGDSSTAIFLYHRDSDRSLILSSENIVSVTMRRGSNAERLLFETSAPK